MRKLGFLLFFFIQAQPLYAETVGVVTAEEWARPRHGEWLAQHASLRDAIRRLNSQSDAILHLRYPGGDEGVLWAEELQVWLVSLGLESSRIELLPGDAEAKAIELIVE